MPQSGIDNNTHGCHQPPPVQWYVAHKKMPPPRTLTQKSTPVPETRRPSTARGAKGGTRQPTPATMRVPPVPFFIINVHSSLFWRRARITLVSCSRRCLYILGQEHLKWSTAQAWGRFENEKASHIGEFRTTLELSLHF